jgi:hypothetical protein
MWVHRTPEEMIQWEKRAEQEARSHGWLIAGIVWVLVSIFAATGCYILFSGGTIAATQSNVSGRFWSRLPLFAIVIAPFAYGIFRYEKKKELAKIKLRSVCPQCDTVRSGNAGMTCQCGGLIVPASTMKWIEK